MTGRPWRKVEPLTGDIRVSCNWFRLREAALLLFIGKYMPLAPGILSKGRRNRDGPLVVNIVIGLACLCLWHPIEVLIALPVVLDAWVLSLVRSESEHEEPPGRRGE